MTSIGVILIQGQGVRMVFEITKQAIKQNAVTSSAILTKEERCVEMVTSGSQLRVDN
ncbi:MAG: hypothetical protein ACJAQ4_002255 [Cryomorphaceae bacterium]